MTARRVSEDPKLTPAEWGTRLADLRAQMAADAAEIAAIRQERAGIALAATGGDVAAVQRMAVLNARNVELLTREDMTGMAIQAAEQSREAASAEEAAAAEVVRQGEISKAAKALIEASLAADRSMAALAGDLRARLEAGKRLYSLGRPVPRVFSPDPICRAAHAAGLANFLNLQRSPTHHLRPLAEADAPLLGLKVSEPAAAPSPEPVEA